MSKKDVYEVRTEELIMPILEENGFDLVDVEYVKEGSNWYLRVYIDKPGGITIEDCVMVSRSMSDILDREDYVEDAYTFEVSSPGLMRPLKKDKDFQRNLGNEVEIKTYRMVDRQKEFAGVLKSYDEQNITIETEDGEKVIARADIALIRLAFEI